MLKLFGYFFTFCFIVAAIQMLLDNPPVLIALLTIIAIMFIVSKIDDRLHPEKVQKRELAKEKDQKNREMENSLLMLIKAQQTIEVSDSIRLQGKGKRLDDIHLIYKDKELCLLSEYKKNQPSQYHNLLSKIFEEDEDLKAETSNTPQILSESSAVVSFKETLRRINACNDDIPDETISRLLSECGSRLEKLQSLINEYPQKSEKTEKLNRHYLPILTDILEQYIAISKAGSENIQIKESLVKTIDLVNEAVDKITSSLFEEDHLDISVNMQVLENLLRKDGLIDSELQASMEDLYHKVK